MIITLEELIDFNEEFLDIKRNNDLEKQQKQFIFNYIKNHYHKLRKTLEIELVHEELKKNIISSLPLFNLGGLTENSKIYLNEQLKYWDTHYIENWNNGKILEEKSIILF